MSDPQLHLRLPGTWHRIDLRGGAETEASVRSVARTVVGTADDRVQQRARLRHELHTAVDAARKASATAMMFSTEIAHGTPLPVTLVVYAPSLLRMSPAIGTEPDKVLAVLEEGIHRSQPELAPSLVRLTGAGLPVCRTHRVDPIEPDALVEDPNGALRLVADYWVPVPDTKQVVMVRFSTPMGEIENVMLSLFDALVGATYFKKPRAAVLA